MCGIAGVVSRNSERTRHLLHTANCALSHRGPDDEGQQVFAFGQAWLGLAQRRLSILDLSPLGHQPMTTPEPNGPWLTFNGEIYNYHGIRDELMALGITFRSTGDTEVLLRALQLWGVDALPKLEGMYALAYFEPENQSLLLARDPAGMKPLYYTTQSDTFVFASEVRAILSSGACPATVDRRGLAGYLAYGAVQHPYTLFAGIESLPAGTHRTMVPATNVSGWAWISPAKAFWKYPTPKPGITRSQALSELPELLNHSVRNHLISDVPVGLFLSSGLDSTILAGLAAKHHPHIQTFTVSFTDEPDFDESELASQSAKRFGLPHERIPILAHDAEAMLPDWLSALDLPSIDGFNVYIIARAVRARGIKVALSGQGGDELFGGYPSFRDVARLRRILRLLRPFSVRVRQAMTSFMTLGQSEVLRGKLHDIMSTDGSVATLALHRRRLLTDEQMTEFGFQHAELQLTADFQNKDAVPDLSDIAHDLTSAISRLESSCYQGNMLLRDGDANGMAHGLEIRLPFLGQQMLNHVHLWPGSTRTPKGQPPKALLRSAFADLLDPRMTKVPKRGFTLPIRRWMLTTLRTSFLSAIETLKDSNILQPEAIDRVVNQFTSKPESPSWSRAFALFVLGDYLKRNSSRSVP